MSVCHREGHFGAFYLLWSTIPLFVLFPRTGREWPSLGSSPVRAEQLRTYLSRGFDCPFVILKGGFWYLKKPGPKPRPALNTFCIFWQLKHAWFWCGEQPGWLPGLLLAAWYAGACAVTCRGPVMGVREWCGRHFYAQHLLLLGGECCLWNLEQPLCCCRGARASNLRVKGRWPKDISAHFQVWCYQLQIIIHWLGCAFKTSAAGNVWPEVTLRRTDSTGWVNEEIMKSFHYCASCFLMSIK